jgi:hypothetical protein
METVILPHHEPGTWFLDGAASLGIWGTYRAEGTITATNFDATYNTGKDRGVFHMFRPPHE